MNLTITDICFILLATGLISWLIWEIIPDSYKKYLGYLRQVRKDKKTGKKKRYSFTWKT